MDKVPAQIRDKFRALGLPKLTGRQCSHFWGRNIVGNVSQDSIVQADDRCRGHGWKLCSHSLLVLHENSGNELMVQCDFYKLLQSLTGEGNGWRGTGNEPPHHLL